MSTPNMHIGLVGPLPPPYGGMANQTRQLEKLLQQEGISVELIRVNAPYQPEWVGSIRGLRAVFRLVPYLIHLWRVANKVQLFHIMANSGWAWHLYAAPAIWVAKFKGKPVIINYRGGEAAAFFQKSFFWVKPSLNKTDAIIVPSGFLEAVFEKKGFPSSIVPNIIDVSRFSVDPGGNNVNKANSPHIVVTRNLESIYDNATAIRAFRIVKDSIHNAQLTIAGVGPEKQMLEDLVSELQLQEAVTFAGRIENDHMAALYRSADMMVNASLVDNMPISILEALASGVPVVTTDAGGIPYLVEHGKTALLVPKQDPVAMSDAILQLLNNPDQAGKLRDEGLKTIQNYTWPVIKDQLLSVYKQVLNNNG
jgi:L-malate glycosyltransferase